jgi:hypothetical protein
MNVQEVSALLVKSVLLPSIRYVVIRILSLLVNGSVLSRSVIRECSVYLGTKKVNNIS